VIGADHVGAKAAGTRPVAFGDLEERQPR
jgi:hypothetical protein